MQRKKDYNCCICDRIGHGYTERVKKKGFFAADNEFEDVDIPPHNWFQMYKQVCLCDCCATNPEAREIACQIAKRKKNFDFRLKILGFIIAAIICGGAYYYSNETSTSQSKKTEFVKKSEKKHRLPKYLNGLSKITSASKLRESLEKISKRYAKNEMGLKGTEEQIEAGNRIMERVYSFLSQSVYRFSEAEASELKENIEDDRDISNYRKKQAVFELDYVSDIILKIQH